MPTPENIIPPKKGEVRNPKGRGNSKGRATIAKEIFAMVGVLPEKTMANLKMMYPEISDKMSVGEIMFIVQTYKAIAKSDTQAFKAVADYMPDMVEELSDNEIYERAISIRDGIIDKHYRFLSEQKDWNIIVGGSRSGKTYNALKWCFLQTLKGKFDLNIIAPSFKMLANGMFLDIQDIIKKSGVEGITIPKQPTRIEMPNGSLWVFEVVTNENEAKRNRGNVIVDEADGIPEEVAMLLGRANGMKMILFNPVKRFWAHKKINEDESNVLHTTWQDNPFIPRPQLQWLHDLKKFGEFAEEGSPERYAYEVYYLGNYSILSGKAFEMEDFDIVDNVPDRFDYMLSYADPSLGTGNDFFAAILFGIKGRTVYAVDCIFSQFAKMGGYVEKLKEWDATWKTPIDHYAESNGVSGVVTGAANEYYDGVLSEVSNSTKKEADIIVYAPTAKKFKFLRSQKMIEFLNQCADFPNDAHDDAPDCLTRGAKIILKYFDIDK